MSNLNLPALSEHAWSLIEANKLVEARSLFEKICEISENNPEPWMMLGSLHAEFSEDNKAILCLEKAINLDPLYPDAHFSLAKIWVKKNRIEDAQYHCQIAIDSDQTYIDAWQLLGVIQEKLGNYTESETCVRRAIELAPTDAAAHANLALVLWKQKRLLESGQSYQRSLDLDPQQVDVWLQLAAVYTHQGTYVEAETCYRNAIGISPENFAAYERLGDILSRLNRREEAIDTFRKASRIKPDNSGVRLRLGWEMHALKQWDGATAAFQEIIRLIPENAEAYFGLGAIYGDRGMKQEEIEYYKHALRFDPENDQYQYHIARLTGGTAPTTPPVDYIRNLFDAYAENFDAHLVGELSYKAPGLIHKAVMELVGTAGEKMDVLDLGCGTGLCAPLFRPLAHHLSGIDLSERMIDVARKLKLYDRLMVGDISVALEALNEAHDLIIAADVFVYVGELTRVFELCAASLKRSGLFVFTVEAAKDEIADYVLESSGRYSHSKQYLRKLADSYGLRISSIQNAVLRMDRGFPIIGYVVVMRREPSF